VLKGKLPGEVDVSLGLLVSPEHPVEDGLAGEGPQVAGLHHKLLEGRLVGCRKKHFKMNSVITKAQIHG
jgi:hypothetical protein